MPDRRPARPVPTLAAALVTPAIAALLLLAAPADARAQIPETFTNLKHFPEDIERRELLANMRAFSFALGVRCQHCHVGEEGQPLSEFDFASDQKATKRKARAMLEMVRAINEAHLADLPDRSDPPVRVTCSTCHGGIPVPRTIGAEIALVLDRDGIDPALARYRELRETFFGERAYDFGEQPLVELGDRLAREERHEAAVRLLELNLEFHPESVQSVVSIGRAWDMAGDTARAIETYRRVLEMEPGADFIRQRIGELGGG